MIFYKPGEHMSKILFKILVFVICVINVFSVKFALAGVIAESNFNSINEGGIGCLQYLPNGVTIANSQSDTHDPPNMLQFYFPKGLQGNGSSGGKCWVVTQSPLTEFYIQYYVKLGINWEWHPVNQKLLYIYTPSHNTHITTYAMTGSPGAQLIGILTNTRNLYANDPKFYFQSGRWYKIYQHYKMNTRDVPNGIVQMWVDDVLQINVNDALILTSSLPSEDTGIRDFDIAPVWGGVANVYKQHDDYIYFDHLIISTNPINAISNINLEKSPNSPYNLQIR